MAPKPGGGAPERKRGRTAKACVQCRATKTRCTFLGASTICDKCIQRGLNCSMLPPGQRVSAPDRSSSQYQSGREPEDSHSQTKVTAPSPPAQQSGAPEHTVDLPHTSDVKQEDVRPNSDGSESQATPTPHWPPALLSTSPQQQQQQQATDSRPWYATPQATGANLDRTGSLSVDTIRAVNGRNSMPQLHTLTAGASTAASNAMHLQRSASVAGPAGMAHPQLQYTQQQRQQQQQQQQQQQPQQPQQSQIQHFPSRHFPGTPYQRSPQQQGQRLPAFDQRPAFENQSYQTQAYQPQVQSSHASPSSFVAPQAYTSPVYLNAADARPNPGQDAALGPVVDNVSIMQSIMRSENMNQVIDVDALPQRDILFSQGSDPISYQQLTSLDVRALMNTSAFTNPMPADSPLSIDSDLLNFAGSEDLLTATDQRGFETEFGIPSDVLKVDQNLADDALQQNHDILKAITETRNRWRYQTAPEFTALQFVDPALRGCMGQASKLLRAQPRVTTRHLLTIGILSRGQVVTLLNVFRTNFNHWVGLPIEPDPSSLLDSLLAKCPLLVTVACCVALRLCQRDVWMRFYPVLVNFLNAEFAATLLESPQNLQFVQAVCIMAIYADSLSFQEYVFDGWYLSGLGLEQLATIGTLTSSLTHVHLRLWNHLCLANLSSAVMTGRHTLVTSEARKVCRRILLEPKVDRFDNCVVAELEMCAATFGYFSFQKPHVEIDKELIEWKKQWNHLNFRLVQFVEPVFLFLSFLIRWTHAWRLDKNLSPGTQDFEFLPDIDAASPLDGIVSLATAASMSNEMLVSDLNSLTAAITAVMDTIHELYFGCLSDQLHNFAFVASTMAMRLQDIIRTREDNSQLAQSAISQSTISIRRLMERFQAASRGLDQARVQAYALLRLLQDGAASNA